jgi:hypothetical protein
LIGHTLGLLWILRPSFMRRTLFIAFVLAMLGVSAVDGSPVHGTRPRRQATVPVSASHKKAGRAATAARDRAAGDRAAAAGDRTAPLFTKIAAPPPVRQHAKIAVRPLVRRNGIRRAHAQGTARRSRHPGGASAPVRAQNHIKPRSTEPRIFVRPQASIPPRGLAAPQNPIEPPSSA